MAADEAMQLDGGGVGVMLDPNAGAHSLEPRREWFSQPCMMGIDEAGRGPVIGPMVYGVVCCPLAYRDALATMPYADSKTLTEERREALFAALRADASLAYAVDVLSAGTISAQMLSRCGKTSLNAIAAASTHRLIQLALDSGVQLTEVYIDTVGDADRYAATLSRSFPSLAFTVCPKADALYPVVSAASIAAKVTRDRALRALAAATAARDAGGPAAATAAAAASRGGGAEGEGYLGTGYPADPCTQAYMERVRDPVFGYDPIVRFSWETCTRALDAGRAAKVEWEADAPPEMANQATLVFATSGGVAAAAPESSGMGRHSFFRLRRLQRVAAL